MKESKVWGDTSAIWAGDNTEVHIINAIKGGYCSKHKHEHKHNLFHVQSGKLLIEIWRDENMVDKTIISENESTVVPPCFYHKFTALENTRALEIYWTVLEKNDIVREDQGGIKK